MGGIKIPPQDSPLKYLRNTKNAGWLMREGGAYLRDTTVICVAYSASQKSLNECLTSGCVCTYTGCSLPYICLHESAYIHVHLCVSVFACLQPNTSFYQSCSEAARAPMVQFVRTSD